MNKITTEKELDYILSESLTDVLALEYGSDKIAEILSEIDPHFEGVRSHNLFAIDRAIGLAKPNFREALKKNVQSFTYKNVLEILDEIETNMGVLPEEAREQIAKKLSIFVRTVKNILQIPVSKELKTIDYTEFFDPFRARTLGSSDDIGISIITSRQRIDATPTDSRLNYHPDIIFEILKRLLNDIPAEELKEKLEYFAARYIEVRYVVNAYGVEAIIGIPATITPSQFEELKNLKALFDEYDVVTTTGIREYDPSTNRGDIGYMLFESDDLAEVIDHIVTNQMVKDCELDEEPTIVFETSQNISM